MDSAVEREAVERMADALAEDGRHLEAALGAGDDDHAAWCRQQRDAAAMLRALLTSLDAAREAGRVAGVREAAEIAKCSCSYADTVVAKALKDGPNSGPRWEHCGENNCGALLAADILALIPKEPPQPAEKDHG